MQLPCQHQYFRQRWCLPPRRPLCQSRAQFVSFPCRQGRGHALAVKYNTPTLPAALPSSPPSFAIATAPAPHTSLAETRRSLTIATSPTPRPLQIALYLDCGGVMHKVRARSSNLILKLRTLCKSSCMTPASAKAGISSQSVVEFSDPLWSRKWTSLALRSLV